jgi:hypothetical protein
MRLRLCDVNHESASRLPEHTDDRSGIGTHYVDAFIKPMNATLEDGTKVTCRRRGLKVTLAVGERKGEGLLRRLAVGPDPVVMLAVALQEAAAQAGVEIEQADGALFVTRP